MRLARASLIGVIGFCAGCAAALLASPLLYRFADRIDSEVWPLLRIWPVGILILLALPWLLGLAGRLLRASVSRSRLQRYPLALALVPPGAAAGLLFVGVPAFTRVPAPPKKSATYIKVVGNDRDIQSFTVYFENGSAVLGSFDRARAAAFALAAEKCGVAGLSVKGFASSAEYAEDNEEQNLKLAERRADSLRDALRRSKFLIEPDRWPNFDTMAHSRLFNDVEEGHRNKPIEFLNRRAEARPKGDWTCLVR